MKGPPSHSLNVYLQNNSQTGPSKRCFPAEAPAASKAQSQTGACAAPPAKFRRVEQEASPVPGKQAFAAATGSVRQREGPEAAPLPGPDGPPPSKFRKVQPSGSCSPSHGTVSSGSTSTAPPPSPAHAAPAADFRKKLEVGMEEARKRRLSGKSDTSHPSPLSPPLKRMCKVASVAWWGRGGSELLRLMQGTSFLKLPVEVPLHSGWEAAFNGSLLQSCGVLQHCLVHSHSCAPDCR